ncbi:MAG: Unknown protein [uncultured Sulfurovum sp.]|uniref:Lipoprotein n=1 Tax=uncultured Sulfurovum sp. TaxID=269237 RepID=A0A6S6TNP0_9BACT|nr:MAG: Unknown protein [uncultured Sulfurovum sp.]
MLLRVILLSFIFLGCSVKELSIQQSDQKVRELETLLITLSPKISRVEARSLARNSILYSQKLTKKYEAIAAPWIQNTLVNIGIKKRGLCYEWGEDLVAYLLRKNYKTLAFHSIGANVGYLNEHSALSVSARGEGVHNSIVLDAWRGSGDLYFKKINEDMEYEWKERAGLYRSLPQ